MIEVTNNRCFVLWTIDKRDKIRHDSTVFTSAHACITEGERQQNKGLIVDYNYSVVMCPQIAGELPRIKELTSQPRAPNIEL